ncbi:MAG: hypothetical protein H8D62_00265 [Bacteroidetes bacterium]|nr:hypothetical protein [Bacteroidota bacterium]
MKNVLLIIGLLAISMSSQAQIEKLSGPRVGFTYITPGLLIDNLSDLPNIGEANPVIAQFGWQLETRFMDEGNTAGIVEFIGMIGGFEQGLFLPSISTLVGFRKNTGFEMAVGPNLSLSGVGMVIGAGFNFKSGNLNFPVNIAFVPGVTKLHESGGDYIGETINPVTGYTEAQFTPYVEEFRNTGHRISIIVGFNSSRN